MATKEKSMHLTTPRRAVVAAPFNNQFPNPNYGPTQQ